MEHGVEQLGRLHPLGKDAQRIEQGRSIGPCGYNNPPKMAHVAEEDRKR